MQIIDPSLQVHGEDQTHQAEVVVTVEVADEDVVYPVEVCLHPHKLHLRTFATVDQERFILNFNVLGGGVSPISRQRAT